MNHQEVENQLREFYQAQLPGNWPDCPRPRKADPKLFGRSMTTSRWALAASVALFLGYYLLAGVFPSTAPNLNVDHQRDIASKPKASGGR